MHYTEHDNIANLLIPRLLHKCSFLVVMAVRPVTKFRSIISKLAMSS